MDSVGRGHFENSTCSHVSDDEDFDLGKKPDELIDGINLRDLCEGKEVIFEINNGFKQNFFKGEEEEFNSDDTSFVDLKALREKRGSPYLNESFEMLAKKMTSITDDDGIKKEMIIRGVGEVVPEHCHAIVHYNLYTEKRPKPFDSTYLRKRPASINLGQGDLIPGLEIAIKTMRKKENSRFFISWKYAFGVLGCPDRIGPKCDIVADITLVDFKTVVDTGLIKESMTEFEKSIVQIKYKQCSGSTEFKAGRLKQSISLYRHSIKLLNSLRLNNYEEERIFQDLRVKSFVNLAVCYNKMGMYELACTMCQEALSIDPNNVKALFHYGRASLALSNFSKARSLLTRLNRMTPNNQDVVKELLKLEQKKQLYDLESKTFWRKAFDGETKNENDKENKEEPDPLVDNCGEHNKDN